MINKRSRYYRLDDTAFPDRSGIGRRCKTIRRLSAVQGQFLHTLEASDRLDHLAYKYYRQSLHWWRICDANLEFTTPLGLLDKTPSMTVLLELVWNTSLPPLAELYATLNDLPGIERIEKNENKGMPDLEVKDSATVFSIAAGLQTELNESVRSQLLSGSLDTALQAESVVLPPDLRFTKPVEGLWQVELNGGDEIYRFHYDADALLINVTQGVIAYHLNLYVTYNKNSLEQQNIFDQITALGFDINEATHQTRVGQSIVIPPRYTGKS